MLKVADTDKKAPVASWLAAGLSGVSGAYASHKLDNYLASLGLPKGLTVNPHAIQAMDRFAEATPADVSNPDKFIYRYADLAHRASGSQLFVEDPRSIAEWSVEAPKLNKTIIDFHTKIKDSAERLEGLLRKISPSLADKYRRKILNNLIDQYFVLKDEFSPLNGWFNSNGVPGVRRRKFLRTHIPQIAESPMEALLRVMFEGAAEGGLPRNQRAINIQTVNSKLGRLGEFTFNEQTGKLQPNPVKPTKFAPGVNTVQDMQRIIDASPVLSEIAKGRSAAYRGAGFRAPVTLIRRLQALRSPKLQMALGALGLGALGFGLRNYKKNREGHNSLLQKLNDFIRDIVYTEDHK